MQWSPQQSEALDTVAAWHKQCSDEINAGRKLSKPIMRVFGYAGTGKTTLARHFADNIDGHTCFAAFTGKAAMVMRKNGCKDASTIHSLIYKVKVNEKTGEATFKWDRNGDAADAALLVIDECSMVSYDLAQDLLRYNRPILVLGDPAQLPPVVSKREQDEGRGAGYFTEAQPDVMLTEIHRQAGDNPIIRLATDVREGRGLSVGEFGQSRVIRVQDICTADAQAAHQILVGTHKKRRAYNRRMREILGRAGDMPENGDRLICLKNDKDTGIFNGGIFEIDKVRKHDQGSAIPLVLSSMDSERQVRVHCLPQCFTGGLEDLHWTDRRGYQEFDYGYAITVHKSQGSQWDDVLIFDESSVFRNDAARHLYTAITRAAEKVTVVV